MNWLFFVGLVVHIIFFFSIFDIYFTSPLVHGMTPHFTEMEAPAKRLVLFVADGLRADKLYELGANGETRAPFLRDIIQHKGAWGVSHTRVPTESRPGHVALIAGFYEDVSAVTKGWKENPVEFDSVFNQSRQTWSWGSPDILPMFAKGASGSHVATHMYPAESEDFAGEDTSKLDTWVFDSVTEFIKKTERNSTLKMQLAQDKIILFLHLLGIDTNGHSHKPYSNEYYRNIRIVDAGIKNISEMIEKYYNNDGKTAFLVTADHGMTNWGSHGAGQPEETLTPIIAWGAGIRGPGAPQTHYTDPFQKDWKLDHIQRSDIRQADVAPLMSCLIGIPYPLNSEGVLPLEYLGSSTEFRAQSLFTNALQILEQFQVKMEEKKNTTLSLLFRPFWPLTHAEQIRIVRDIRHFLREENFSQAMLRIRVLIDLALQGLRYYHSYDRFFLGQSVLLGFVGWMLYIFTVIVQDHTSLSRSRVSLESVGIPACFRTRNLQIIFSGLSCIIVLLLHAQHLPWTHYLYCLLPVFTWYIPFKRYHVFLDVLQYIQKNDLLTSTVAKLVIGVIGLEIMVGCFFYRHFLTFGLIGMAIWPLTSSLVKAEKPLVFCWAAACLSLSIFPMMPVIGRQSNYNLVYMAGFLSIAISAYCVKRKEINILKIRNRKILYLTIFQMIALGVCIFVVKSTNHSIAEKLPVPFINNIASWIILGLSFITPFFSSTQMLPRLLNISLAFLAPYLLMSSSNEGLFYLALCGQLFLWLRMELKMSSNQKHVKVEDMEFQLSLVNYQRKLLPEDLRCGFLFIFLVLTAFFGTGNIASINTFDPSSVYCFLTVFNPFLMGSLLMCKILIPILLVACTFTSLHVVLQVPKQSFLLIVLLMTDFMALHFFFLVKDEGSWLEIGTSISHFVIVMAMIIFLILLLALSQIFTTITLRIPCRNQGKIDKNN